jgi:Flp pilus assembly protein TadD
MAIKDPTAWMQDLEFYMDDENVADTADTIEPTLLYGGSKVAAGAWLALVGIIGGAFGGVTVSPAIRSLAPFVAYLIVAGLLLRGLHPLTVRLLDRAVGWVAMFGFFWVALLGCFAVLGARMDSRLAAYGISVGLGAFIGMMYGAFPPGGSKKEDVWMSMALPLAPLGSGLAAYLLRHAPGASDTALGAALGGACAGGVWMVPMGFLLTRLWSEAEALAQMGLLYLHNDNFASKAVAFFDRAIATDPDDASYYHLRGVAWSRMGDPQRASADWDKALALAPNDPNPHLYRGVDALKRGLRDEAIRCFELALEKNPNFAAAHRYLSTVYEQQGNVDRATEHANRAVEIGSDDARAHSHRGHLHFRRGALEHALKDAQRAIRLDSRLATAYVVRGHALAALGQRQQAADSYREAMDLEPEPSVREDAVRSLELLAEDSQFDDPS